MYTRANLRADFARFCGLCCGTHSVFSLPALAFLFLGGRRMKYTLGGLAASVALFLSALSIEAQIVYSGDQHIVINWSDYRVEPSQTSSDPEALKLDLNGDGVADFSLFTQKIGPFPTSPIGFGLRGLNGSQYAGSSSLTLDLFSAGVSLGSGPQWSTGTSGVPVHPGQNWWGNSFYGYFNSTSSPVSYIGFKLFFQGSQHFGWLAYELPPVANSALTIDGWAFQSAVETPIIAGDPGLATPVPEPSTYGLFGALAIAGLTWARRARSGADRRS